MGNFVEFKHKGITYSGWDPAVSQRSFDSIPKTVVEPLVNHLIVKAKYTDLDSPVEVCSDPTGCARKRNGYAGRSIVFGIGTAVNSKTGNVCYYKMCYECHRPLFKEDCYKIDGIMGTLEPVDLDFLDDFDF